MEGEPLNVNCEKCGRPNAARDLRFNNVVCRACHIQQQEYEQTQAEKLRALADPTAWRLSRVSDPLDFEPSVPLSKAEFDPTDDVRPDYIVGPDTTPAETSLSLTSEPALRERMQDPAYTPK